MKRTKKGVMERVAAIRRGTIRYALTLFCSLLLPGNVIVSAQQASATDVSPLDQLLRREEFWALAAFAEDDIIGGVTHTRCR
jgi:predicted transcriptional regulator